MPTIYSALKINQRLQNQFPPPSKNYFMKQHYI